MMVTVSVRSKKYNCDISIHQKITIIRGHSGRGKTVFTKAVSDSSGAYSVSLSDTSYQVLALTKDGWWDIVRGGIDRENKRIYIIDDVDFITTHEFASLFKQDKLSYYIIINRFEVMSVNSLNIVPFAVSEVYEFIANGKDHTLKKFYTYTESEVTSIGVDYCLTEDSNSGLDFFKLLCGERALVETSFGKDSVLSHLRASTFKWHNKTMILFVDMSAFGSWYELVYEYLLTSPVNAIILSNYMSFEYLLLCSKMLNFDFTKLSNSDITSEASFEILCERLIVDVTKATPYSYKKESLNGCYFKNCCYKQRSLTGSTSEVCGVGISGDKLDGLLRGTEFEALLSLRS